MPARERVKGPIRPVDMRPHSAPRRRSVDQYYQRCYHYLMSVIKRSVSLDDYVAEQVEAAADADGVSFSSWLSSAAEHRLLLREGLSGIRDWEADAGQLTTEERAVGEALLDRLLSDQTAKSA